MVKEVLPQPSTFDELRSAIVDGRYRLSRRLTEAARYIVEHPNYAALNSVNELAVQAGVSPSTLSRLAQSMGFSGFADMQRLLREPLANAAPSYGERIRHFRGEQVVPDTTDSISVLREFSQANLVSLEHLRDTASSVPLDAAIQLLIKAECIHVVGLQRSFPIAVYLSYALNRIGCRACLISGIGGALSEQCKAVGTRDLLIAISFPQYAEDTVKACQSIYDRSIPILVLTDSILSPIAQFAKVALEVNDAQLLGFRSLTASLSLAQTLVMGAAFKLRARIESSDSSVESGKPAAGVNLSDINC